MPEITQGGFLISKIQKISKRIFARILKDNDLTINPGQGRILFILWQEDNISIQDLAKKVSLSSSTLTSMLDRMEKNEMLARIPKEDDRRSYLLKLLPKAKALKKKFEDVSSQMTEIYYKDFSHEEISDFEEKLVKIFENLENYHQNR